MNLKQYFSTEPHGAKKEMALYLGITVNYISLLINERRKASPKLAIAIEQATQGLVSKKELRPDVYQE